MGFLDKLFGSSNEKASGGTATMEPPPALTCPHSVLLPRWDAVDDIGKEDRATHYICEACEQKFSPDEARALQETMSERLQEVTAEAPEATP